MDRFSPRARQVHALKARSLRTDAGLLSLNALGAGFALGASTGDARFWPAMGVAAVNIFFVFVRLRRFQ